MKLNKNQTIFVSVAAVIGLILFLMPSSKTTTTTPKSPSVKKNVGPRLEESRKELQELMSMAKEEIKPASSKKSINRNPFVPSTSAGSRNDQGLVLQGIFGGGDKPCAIISNKVVGIGEQIEGHTLKDVKNDYIVLIDGTGQQTMISMKAAFATHVENPGPESVKSAHNDGEGKEARVPVRRIPPGRPKAASANKAN